MPPRPDDQARTLTQQAQGVCESDPIEAERLANGALTLLGARGNPVVRADALRWRGLARLRQARYPSAAEDLSSAERLYADLEDAPTRLECLLACGKAQRGAGALRESGGCFNAALELARDAGNRDAQAAALNGLAFVSHALGDVQGAVAHLSAALGLQQELGDAAGQGASLNNLGILHTDAGNYPAALDALQRSLEFVRAASPGSETEASALINVGNIYQELHNLDGAERRFLEALEIARAAHETSLELIALGNLAELSFLRGDLDAAAAAYQEVLSASEQGGQMNTQVAALEGLARVHSARTPSLALEAVHRALTLVEATGDRSRAARLLLALAEAQAANADMPGAEATLQRALKLAVELGAKRLRFECEDALAGHAERNGQLAVALEHSKDARRLERELFSEEGERRLSALSVQYELERTRADAQAYRRRTEETQRANATLEQRVRERTRDLEDEQFETVVRLAEAAEFRDDSTGLHTQRVGQVSALIAEALGLPAEDVDRLRVAARLHDVGKIAIPDAILQKPGRLDAEEFERVKTHTTIGARMLSGGRSPILRAAERIALAHHERFDGRGYPGGLRGESIPLFARIVAVADVFDALLSERPYKQAWTPEQARAEIHSLSGSAFDPRVVQAFMAVTSAPGVSPTDAPSPLEERRRRPLDLLSGWDDPLPSEDRLALQGAWEERDANPAECLAVSTRVMAAARESGDRVAFAYAQRNLGFLEYAAARYAAAITALSEGLVVGQALDDHVLTRDCHNFLGAAYSALGDYATAAEHVQATLDQCRAAGDQPGLVSAITNLGLLHHYLGQDTQAVEAQRSAIVLSEELNDPAREAAARNNLGVALLALGRPQEALPELESALVLAREVNAPTLEVRALLNLGEAHAQLEHRAPALEALAQALDKARRGQDREGEGLANLSLGIAQARLDEPALAVAPLQAALRLAQAAGLKSLEAGAHEQLASAYQRLDQPREALRHLQAHQDLERSLKAGEVERRLLATSAQREIERSRAESEIFRLRNIDLARALAGLQDADRQKSELLRALEEKTRELDRQAREDDLTGLFNRRSLETELARVFRDARSDNGLLSVAMLDVDGFKNVNDSFSHALGDTTLREVARIIRACCREGDLCARYGGDEFVLVMPRTAAARAYQTCEAIREAVEGHDWTALQPGLRLTVSAGVSDDLSVEQPERLLDLADQRLYEAKHAGRNRVAV